MNGIGKTGMNNNRDPISIWRVIIPSDVDREEYIKTCYLTGTVSLVNENAEFSHRTKVGKLALQLISFPEDLKSYGSEVVCVSAPYSGRLYIIDVYASSTEYNDQQENQFRFFKTDNSGGYAELRVDGNGKILLSVDSEETADITISVTNKDREGTFNLNVNGELKVINDGTTLVQTTKEIKLEQLEGEESTSVTIVKDLVTIKTEKLVVNSDSEAMLLGNSTTDFLSDWLDILGSESAGPYPLLNQTKYIQLKQRLEDLKSKKSFLD